MVIERTENNTEHIVNFCPNDNITTLKFVNKTYRFPNTLKIGSIENTVKWAFSGDSSIIEYIHPGCGSCTTNCKIVTTDEIKTIQADFAEKDVINWKEISQEDLNKRYPEKIYAFSKNIRVFLKDGKPLRVKNQRGVEILNLEKDSFVLDFGGYVDLSSLFTETNPSGEESQ